MVGRYASRIAPILAIALLSGVFCLAVPAAINAQAPPTQMDVDGLKDAARSERQSAAERADKARRWRGLAKAAREAADKALDDRDRKRWEKSAAEREATAKKLEQDAKELIEAAKKKEAKAAELQEDVSARKQAEDREKAQTKKQDEEIARKLAEEAAAKPAFRMSVEDTIGVWRSKDTDAIFVIVQEDPNRQVYGYRLEAHTKNRAWKGEYEPFDAGDSRRVENARLTFKYKPIAES